MANINILTVSSPIYSNSSETSIDCIVTFNSIDGEHHFTATASDPEPHGQQLWEELQAGDHGAIGSYVAPILTPLELGLAAISAGIAITSTGTPSLDGTYPIDAETQAKLNSVITYLMLNSAFPPASAASLPWYDIEGNVHTFTSVSSFKNFATALADFVAHIDIFVSSDGEIGSIPSNEITIP